MKLVVCDIGNKEPFEFCSGAANNSTIIIYNTLPQQTLNLGQKTNMRIHYLNASKTLDPQKLKQKTILLSDFDNFKFNNIDDLALFSNYVYYLSLNNTVIGYGSTNNLKYLYNVAIRDENTYNQLKNTLTNNAQFVQFCKYVLDSFTFNTDILGFSLFIIYKKYLINDPTIIIQ